LIFARNLKLFRDVSPVSGMESTPYCFFKTGLTKRQPMVGRKFPPWDADTPLHPVKLISPSQVGVRSMSGHRSDAKAESAFNARRKFTTPPSLALRHPVLKKQYGRRLHAETGRNVAEEFKISREDQDGFALRSNSALPKPGVLFFAEELSQSNSRQKGNHRRFQR